MSTKAYQEGRSGINTFTNQLCMYIFSEPPPRAPQAYLQYIEQEKFIQLASEYANTSKVGSIHTSKEANYWHCIQHFFNLLEVTPASI
jgi:hypothetical protein